MLFINMFNLQHFFLTGYDSWMWAKPNEAFYEDGRAEWRLPKRGAIVHWQLRSTLCGMFVQPFSLVSYYFLELNLMILFFFYFQETYNNQLRETYMDDPSTHLDFDLNLWIEAGSSGRSDRNRVYGLFNTRTENLWTTRSVSTIGSLQSISST